MHKSFGLRVAGLTETDRHSRLGAESGTELTVQYLCAVLSKADERTRAADPFATSTRRLSARRLGGPTAGVVGAIAR